MADLLCRIEKNPEKYRKKLRKAFRDNVEVVRLFRSDRFFSGFGHSFTMAEISRKGFNLEFEQVLVQHHYHQRLRSALGFEKAYFRGYVEDYPGYGGICFVGVDICW
jgi:hypothetical protein